MSMEKIWAQLEGKIKECPCCHQWFSHEARIEGRAWELLDETVTRHGKTTSGIIGLPTSWKMQTGFWNVICPTCGWVGRFKERKE